MSRARDLADGTFSGAFSADSPTFVVDATNNNVGIGTTPASGVALDIRNNSTTTILDMRNANSSGYGIYVAACGSSSQYVQKWANYDNNHLATLDGSGNLVVGKTSPGSISNFGNELANAGYAMHSRSAGCPLFLGRAVSTGDMLAFYYGSSTPDTFRGSISTNGTSISYNTSSDYRLKENVADLTGAIDRVKQVPVHRFNFIADPDRTVDGFIAHEVQAVVPEAVTGTQDGMKTEEYEVTPAVLDNDGNVVTEAVMGTREVPEYQGIDQSKLVPLLTAAIKEQQALIEDLQTRLAALEAV